MQNVRDTIRPRIAVSIGMVMVTLLAVSACKTTEQITPDEQERRAEVRAMLLEMNKPPQTPQETSSPFNAEWEKDSEEFKAELKADTDAFSGLQVDVIAVVNALAQQSVTCKDSKWSEAGRTVGSIETLADRRWAYSQRDTPYYQRIPQARDTSLKFYKMFTDTALKSRFGLADLALKKECFEIADLHFRHVIQRYTGTAYAAYRERAKVGIDDVRAKRKS